MDLKNTYNKIAEDWMKDHLNDPWWKEGTDIFLSFLPNGASVLDVGCGGGIKSKYISGKGFKVTGIDFSEKMIEIAKREYSGINFQVFDMYDIEKYPKKFDAVFSQASLLHIPKLKVFGVMKKMRTRLNQNGTLYIAVKSLKEDKIEEKTVKENDYGYEYERFFSYFTPEELKGYISKLGMKVLWQNDFVPGKWIQIVAR